MNHLPQYLMVLCLAFLAIEHYSVLAILDATKKKEIEWGINIISTFLRSGILISILIWGGFFK